LAAGDHGGFLKHLLEFSEGGNRIVQPVPVRSNQLPTYAELPSAKNSITDVPFVVGCEKRQAFAIVMRAEAAKRMMGQTPIEIGADAKTRNRRD
jgi:hypothetical protein